MVPPQGSRASGRDGAVRAAVLPRPALVCYVEARSGHQRVRNPDTGEETLQPLMEGLTPGARKPNAFSERPKPCRRRTPCRSSSPRLQEMVSLSGMQSSHFVPAAETVGTASVWTAPFPAPDKFPAPCPPAAEQPWLSGMEFLNVTPSALPAYCWGFGPRSRNRADAAALMKADMTLRERYLGRGRHGEASRFGLDAGWPSPAPSAPDSSLQQARRRRRGHGAPASPPAVGRPALHPRLPPLRPAPRNPFTLPANGLPDAQQAASRTPRASSIPLCAGRKGSSRHHRRLEYGVGDTLPNTGDVIRFIGSDGVRLYSPSRNAEWSRPTPGTTYKPRLSTNSFAAPLRRVENTMRQRPVSILGSGLVLSARGLFPKQDKSRSSWITGSSSQDSQGYSPAPSDLRPEPRVIMCHTENRNRPRPVPCPPFPSPSRLITWMWASFCAASRPPPGSTSCSEPQ